MPIRAKKAIPKARVNPEVFCGFLSGVTPNPIIPAISMTALATPSMVAMATKDPIKNAIRPITPTTNISIHPQEGMRFHREVAGGFEKAMELPQ